MALRHPVVDVAVRIDQVEVVAQQDVEDGVSQFFIAGEAAEVVDNEQVEDMLLASCLRSSTVCRFRMSFV